MGTSLGKIRKKSQQKEMNVFLEIGGLIYLCTYINKYIHIYYICIRMFIHKTRLGIYWVYRYIPR